ncbi:MAG: ligand-binding sensor domain-containing protein, partial [Flammeovirgaceae bacterium]
MLNPNDLPNPLNHHIKKISCVIGVLSLFFGYSITLFGQENIIYKHYTVDDGLPHNIGYGLLQDRKGYLWIGTDDGLARFDGTTWKVYGTKEGLTSPYPIDIAEMPDETLWLGMWAGAINLLTQDTITPLQATNGVKKINGLGILNDSVVAAWNYADLYFYTKKKEQWYCTERKRLVSYPDQPNQPRLVHCAIEWKKNPGKPLETDFLITKNQQLLLFGGLPWLLIYENDSTQTPILRKELAGDVIFGAYEASPQEFWLSGKGKITHIYPNKVKETFEEGLPNETIYYLNVVANKYAYLITGDSRFRGRKAYRYDLETKELVNLTKLLGMNTVPSQMLQDDEQNLWLTTDGDGVFCFYFHPFKQYSIASGLSFAFVTTIEADQRNRIWVGTKDGLFAFKNERFQEFQIDIDLSSSNRLTNITDLLFPSNRPNEAWVAGNVPVIHMTDIQQKHWEKESLIGNQLYLNTDGNLIGAVVKEGDLYAQRPIPTLTNYGYLEMKIGHYYQLQGQICIGKHYDFKGRKLFWLSTQDSLYTFDEHFQAQLIRQNLSIEKLNAILIDRQQNIWLGTDGGLMQLAKEKDQYTLVNTFTQRDGLTSSKCRALALDKNGLLWVGTPKG